MLPVNLIYRSSRHRLYLATGTHELTGDQAARLYELQHSQPSYDEYCSKLAAIILKPSIFNLRQLAWILAINNEAFEQLTPALEPFLPISAGSNNGTQDLQLVFSNRQEKQVLPRFWYKGWFYEGPSTRLSNITLEEFAYADYYFLQYHKNPSRDNMLLLLACLYRPWRWDNLRQYGDARQQFNSHTIESRAAHFESTLPRYGYYSLEFFRSGRELITERFKDLFSQENKGKASSSGNGWVNLMYSMAGPQFGTVQQTGQTRLGDVLLYCRQLKQENERIEAQRNKNGL